MRKQNNTIPKLVHVVLVNELQPNNQLGNVLGIIKLLKFIIGYTKSIEFCSGSVRQRYKFSFMSIL